MTTKHDALRSVNYGRRMLLDARHAIKEDRLDDAHDRAVWGKAFAEQAIDQIEELQKPDPEPTPEPEPPPADPEPKDELWAWDARAARREPFSDAWVAEFISHALDKQPTLVVNRWAVAVCDAGPGDPEYVIRLREGEQGGNITVRIPLGARPAPAGDGHLTVRDAERGIETDFWQARYNAETGRIDLASAAIAFPLGAVNVGSKGYAGNAANTPLRRGLVTPEMIADGHIPHTLQFGNPRIGGRKSPPAEDYRYPAIHNIPTCGSDCENKWPEGTWVAFPPDFDETELDVPGYAKVVAAAMRDKGMVCRDNAGALGIYAQAPLNGATSWGEVGIAGDWPPLDLPWERLQVLEPPRP